MYFPNNLNYNCCCYFADQLLQANKRLNKQLAMATTHMLNKNANFFVFKLATSINRSHLVFVYDKLITGHIQRQLDL